MFVFGDERSIRRLEAFKGLRSVTSGQDQGFNVQVPLVNSDNYDNWMVVSVEQKDVGSDIWYSSAGPDQNYPCATILETGELLIRLYHASSQSGNMGWRVLLLNTLAETE